MPDLPDRATERRDARELEAALRTVERLRRAQEPVSTPGAHAMARDDVGRPWLAAVVVVGLLLTLAFVTRLGSGDEATATEPELYLKPPSFTPGEGAYAFLWTHPESGQPIGFDPCRPIRYVVNPAGAPSDWRELIGAGVRHAEWASGLDLVNAGTTTQRPFDPLGMDRALGERPVVIGFADEDEIPGLAGSVVGLGGGVPGNLTATQAYFASGSIALDTDYFDSETVDLDHRQAVVDHELGHVLGLDHVDDPGQLMHPGDTAHSLTFGPGDLEGLAALADVPCQ